MNIRELGHVAFRCRDLERSVNFYCGILGFRKKCVLTYGDLAEGIRKKAGDNGYEPSAERLKSLEEKKDRIWFLFVEVAPRQFLELFDAGDADEACIPDERKLNYQHLALIVDDIRATEKEMQSRGVALDHEVGYNLDGNYSMWIHDPDGNQIEFIQYTEKALQFI